MVYSFLSVDLIYLQLQSKKKNIIDNPVFYLNEFNFVYKLHSELYLENRQKAASIAQNNRIRKIINEIIQEITRKKRFVVVRHDITTNILPNTDIKIVLTANLITRINRRCDETKSTATEITRNILFRDEKLYKFIEDAIKVSTSIDTTYLSINQ
ncbi:14383_t:CDS:1, partial [Dentiscutata erythropus]